MNPFDPALFLKKLFIRFRDSRDNPFIIIYRDTSTILTETFWQIADWQARYIELATMNNGVFKPKMYINIAFLSESSLIGPQPEIIIPVGFLKTDSSRLTLSCQVTTEDNNFFMNSSTDFKKVIQDANNLIKQGECPFVFVDAESFIFEVLVPPIDK
jgi:hypothetical protein